MAEGLVANLITRCQDEPQADCCATSSAQATRETRRSTGGEYEQRKISSASCFSGNFH